MKYFFTFLVLISQIVVLLGQSKNYAAYHFLSEEEMLNNNTSESKSFVETNPPVGDVRNIAEWEQMEGVLITYLSGEFGIPYSFIAEMSENCIVTTIVSGLSQENTVKSLYTSNDVNLANCNFVYAPIDSWWSRDYSPWYIAVNNSEIAIIDFPYNRPSRPNDDNMPVVMANFLSEDLYGMNVTNTGGNYMCDGYGVAAQTDLVLDEEELTENQIALKMQDYLGIENYFVRPDPLDDYIKHIDCWGKFIDIDKVIITQVPESDYRYDDYEAAAAFFAETNCSYGYPYQVFRVQAANYNDYDTNPYSNSLILNNKVFVAQTGSSLDDEAIAVYQEAMPGYEVYGVSSSGWYNTDALHCRTYGIADREMLFIKHYPLFGIVDSDNGYIVDAEVYSYAGNEIENGYPKLFYSINDGFSFEEIIMESVPVKTGQYQAIIPEQTEGTEIVYYIQAVDSEGKTANHPFIGEPDPHIFTAGTETPVVNVEIIENEYFNIYPNPCKGKFFVWVEVENQTNTNLEIYNIAGSKIYSQSLNLNAGENLQKIESYDLSTGIYTVKIQSGKNTLIRKLIVQ